MGVCVFRVWSCCVFELSLLVMLVSVSDYSKHWFSPTQQFCPFFFGHRTLILFRCWVAKSSRPAASRRGSESASDQASCNNYQPAGSWLGIDMRCSSDQGEGGSLEGLLRQLPTDASGGGRNKGSLRTLFYKDTDSVWEGFTLTTESPPKGPTF